VKPSQKFAYRIFFEGGGVFFFILEKFGCVVFLGFAALDLGPSALNLRPARTEITPVKDFHTRIKPLALASGHGRYMTVTPERTLFSVGEWPLHVAVINFNRCTSETVS
jgi:hypothetical protein